MDPQFALAFIIRAILVYFIVPWNHTEYFTDTSPNSVTLKEHENMYIRDIREENFTDAAVVTPTCPSGGHLDHNKCVDKLSQTCVCPTGTFYSDPNGVCCINKECRRWWGQQCYCPNNYNKTYDSCVRAYDPTLTCPTGYEVLTKDNRSICVKKLVCPTGYVLKNDGTKNSCVKS